jgi:hypothetical protein
MPGVPDVTIPFTQVPNDGTTLCYAGRMPDEPDQCVVIQDQEGRFFGRSQVGTYLIHPAVRLIVRALPPEDAATVLAQTIANALNAIANVTVTMSDQSVHYVKTVYRTAPIKPLGEEVGRKRFLFIISARIAFQDNEPVLG